MAKNETRRALVPSPAPGEPAARPPTDPRREQHGKLFARDAFFAAAYARWAFYEAVVEGHRMDARKTRAAMREHLLSQGMAGGDDQPGYVPEAEFEAACGMSLADAEAALEAAEAAIDARGRALLGPGYLGFKNRP